MGTPQVLTEAVRSVLKTKARDGRTTKNEATILVMKRIEHAGGPTKFGIGAAAMRMALAHLIGIEVARQFKMGLSDHAVKFSLPAATPAEVIEALGRVPCWIAIDEGGSADWIPSLRATPDHWLANAALKEKKAKQTEARANASMDIARFLALNKFESLEEALVKGGDV